MTDYLQPAGVVLFLLSLVLLGMPHGAVDHWVFFRAVRRKMRVGGLALFIVGYVLVAGCFFSLWLLAPVFCAIGLLGLTTYHWGEGDYLWERDRGWKPPVWFWLWRGLIPMGIPFIAHPEMAVRVLESAVVLVDDQQAPDLAVVSAPVTSLILTGLLITFFVLQWWQSRVARPRRLLWEDLGLVAGFIWLPPLLAIAIYFVGWHSYRHVRWLGQWVGPPIGGQNQQVDWKRFIWAATPFTIPAVAAVAVLAALSPPEQGGVMAWVGSYLIWLWALTWPHAWVCHLAAKQRQRESVRPMASGKRTYNVTY